LKREAPYENLPQTMYFKTSSPDLIYANSFYKQSPATSSAAISGNPKLTHEFLINQISL